MLSHGRTHRLSRLLRERAAEVPTLQLQGGLDARPRVPGTPACAPAALTGAHFSAALRGSPLWCARGTCSSARGVVRVCLERSGTE